MPKITGVRRSSRLEHRASEYRNYLDMATNRMLEATSCLNVDEDADLVEQFTTFAAAVKVIADTTRTIEKEQRTIAPHLKTVAMDLCVENVVGSFSTLRNSMMRALAPLYKIIHRAGTYTPPDKVIRRKHITCGVCGDDDEFFVSGRVTLKRCGTARARHTLCGGCFIRWFVVHAESTCPMCRHCHFPEEVSESLIADLDHDDRAELADGDAAESDIGLARSDGR